MKKLLSIIITILIVTGLLTACMQNRNNTVPSGQMQTAQPSGQQSQSPASTPNTAGFIGEDAAKEIALEKAGITGDGVIFDRTELDVDNGVWQYEVEFRKGVTEYSADIKADDGTILSWEVENYD